METISLEDANAFWLHFYCADHDSRLYSIMNGRPLERFPKRDVHPSLISYFIENRGRSEDKSNQGNCILKNCGVLHASGELESRKTRGV